MQTFTDFKQLLIIKRYAPSTVKSYIGLLISFQKQIAVHNSIDLLKDFQLVDKVREIVTKNNLSISTQKQLIAAITLYFKEIHQREVNFYSVYPRIKEKPLPVILSTQEVSRILKNCKNIKHKAMLTLVYALGLRSGELINLKLIDIDKNRKIVHIKGSKNKKDRIIPLPNGLSDLMNAYYLEYKPKTYLFNGQSLETYNAQSLRKVFKKACYNARVNKKVTLHSLRHAYATHLMDAGTDVRIIKELLGHNNLRTTLIYTHVTTRTLENLPNPLDFL